jgi:hypothetical protein
MASSRSFTFEHVLCIATSASEGMILSKGTSCDTVEGSLKKICSPEKLVMSIVLYLQKWTKVFGEACFPRYKQLCTINITPAGSMHASLTLLMSNIENHRS